MGCQINKDLYGRKMEGEYNWKKKFESATTAAPKWVGHLHYEDIYNEKETIVREMCLHCFHLFWAPMVFHNPFVAHCSSPPSETFQLLLHCVNKHVLHTKNTCDLFVVAHTCNNSSWEI